MDWDRIHRDSEKRLLGAARRARQAEVELEQIRQQLLAFGIHQNPDETVLEMVGNALSASKMRGHLLKELQRQIAALEAELQQLREGRIGEPTA